MKTCTTCRYSNEWHSQSAEHCGKCLDDSEDGVEFPLYVQSLAYPAKYETEDNNENKV